MVAKTQLIKCFSLVCILFFITSPLLADYYYPPTDDSTWDTVSATSLGWNQSKLDDLVTWIGNDNANGFLIIYQGKIVTEAYWNGWDEASSDKIWSAAKTISSSLFGIMEDQSYFSINGTVQTYLGDWLTHYSCNGYSWEDDIIAYDLLTMTSGLTEGLFNITCPDPEVTPGTFWEYNTKAYHKVNDIMDSPGSIDLPTFSSDNLFDVIGMNHTTWSDRELKTMDSSIRDMARFGLMMLSDGYWDGIEVVPSDYVALMTTSSQTLNPAYGLLTWLNGTDGWRMTTYNDGWMIRSAPEDMFMALGYEDKKIYMVPSTDLVKQCRLIALNLCYAGHPRTNWTNEQNITNWTFYSSTY